MAREEQRGAARGIQLSCGSKERLSSRSTSEGSCLPTASPTTEEVEKIFSLLIFNDKIKTAVLRRGGEGGTDGGALEAGEVMELSFSLRLACDDFLDTAGDAVDDIDISGYLWR